MYKNIFEIEMKECDAIFFDKDTRVHDSRNRYAYKALENGNELINSVFTAHISLYKILINKHATYRSSRSTTLTKYRKSSLCGRSFAWKLRYRFLLDVCTRYSREIRTPYSHYVLLTEIFMIVK